MKLLIASIFCFLISSTCLLAQRHEILSDNISSLQVVAENDWMALPIIKIGTGDRVNISFDDLTHTYQRYAYRIEHCEADWSKSEELFESDYISGFASGNIIDDVVESINTNTLYTHYQLSLPNGDCRIKRSGNYRVYIYDDNNEDDIVAVVCFMVLEPKVGVDMSVTTNTDVDINGTHQQVSMEIAYGDLRITNQSEQIKTIVMQNQQWHDARINAKPQYIMPKGLRWEHCKDYIFEAGNEYRKFEVLDPSHPTLGIDRIDWDGFDYNVSLFPDLPTNNYIYDEDANGSFYIRNSDNFENDRTSDYVLVHFTLHTPYRYSGNIYINGAWTYDRFSPEYRMQYDTENKVYRAAIRLKLGYYSYHYLLVDTDNTIKNLPSQGNFYQTENTYQALVYYKEQCGRSDRLVGYGQVSSR